MSVSLEAHGPSISVSIWRVRKGVVKEVVIEGDGLVHRKESEKNVEAFGTKSNQQSPASLIHRIHTLARQPLRIRFDDDL
jgi:hypothetical protein